MDQYSRNSNPSHPPLIENDVDRFRHRVGETFARELDDLIASAETVQHSEPQPQPVADEMAEVTPSEEAAIEVAVAVYEAVAEQEVTPSGIEPEPQPPPRAASSVKLL